MSDTAGATLIPVLSEEELATLPEAERLELYQNLEAGIARLKQSLDLASLPKEDSESSSTDED